MDNKLTYLLLVLFLDFVFKDPAYFFHPVRLQGKFLLWFESRVKNYGFLKFWGLLGVLGLVGCSCGVVYLLTKGKAGWFFYVYFGYAVIAFGSLFKEGITIYNVWNKDLESVRERLKFLVSRDVSSLDQAGLSKSLIETLAENFNDGLIAPLFYLVLGGPVVAWGYKAISTIDSMWGYKHSHYQELGWSGAKLDDLLAYLPARISAFLFYLAGVTLGKGKISLKRVYLDAQKTESPNAGWPMAMMAHLLNIELGGKAVYFGREKIKPILGHPENNPNLNKIQECLLLLIIAYLWLVFLLFLIFFIKDKFF